MDIRKQIEWLKPDRILKLYDGEKNMTGLNRLLIIGAGKNGTDCVLRAKHIAENRFSSPNVGIRFLAFDYESNLDGAEYCGSVLSDEEKIAVNPEEAIYKYLNNPELLPQNVSEWFDMGLKNYSDSAPKYGLQKRQCGRIALFHCIGTLLERLDSLIDFFSENENPLEIELTGNLGDALFGGTVVDFGYILTALFKTADFPVKISSLMFAADTAQLFEKDARDLANYYANTIITKGELDMFQSRRKSFSQKYTRSFEVNSDKPPFNTCVIASAEKTYGMTLTLAAEKLLSEGEFIYKTDDDADRMVSYNMLEQNGSHTFRYLSYDVAGAEIPLGKIVSYLSVRLFGGFCGFLRENRVSTYQLGIFQSKVIPDADFLASRAGKIPKIEFDESSNPLFSPKSLKKNQDASRKYVEDKADEYARLVEKGAAVVLPEIAESIIADCENAAINIAQGPFYADEIMWECLSELQNVIKKTRDEKENTDYLKERREQLLISDFRKLRNTPAILSANNVRLCISSLSDYADILKKYKTTEIMMNFYNSLYGRLKNYYENTFKESIRIFSLDASEFLEYMKDGGESCIREAFDVSSPEILKKLDKLVEEVPESTKTLAFRRMKLPGSGGSEREFAEEIVNLAAKCFGGFLLMGYNDFCEFFGADDSVRDALQNCFDRISVKTPTLDGQPLTRVLCPKNIKQGDVAQLKASRQGINYIWNVSPLFNAAIVVQIKGGVKFDELRDYNQWENMRYAYVNDSLKKHGIHIWTSGSSSKK